MQIEIYSPTNGQPLPPVQWNYEAVKQWVEAGLSVYAGRIYTEDTVNEAKRDRATLNKLSDAIDTRRKEMKAMYLRPYEEFETQAKELTARIKDVSAEIDGQVKAFENFRKEEKKEKIKAELYAPMIGNLAGLIPYERLHNPKWLNVTMGMSDVEEDMSRQLEKITSGLSAIDMLGLDTELATQIKDVFLRSFDLAEALLEKDRLIRQREELERIKAAQIAENPVQYTPEKAETPTEARHGENDGSEDMHTVTFRIRVTTAQLKLLGDFMKANNIRPERV